MPNTRQFKQRESVLELGGADAAATTPGIVDTLTASVASILTAASAERALSEVLPKIAQLVPIDRVIVTERTEAAVVPAPPAAPSTRLFSWASPEIAVASERSLLEEATGDPFAECVRPLSHGQSVSLSRPTASESVRALLDGAGIWNLLIVPIMVKGRHCAEVCFESRAAEGIWDHEDLGILGLVAAAIAAVLSRDRQLQALTSAQEQIVQLARTDGLTGVANRATFSERLRQAFAASQRGAHAFAVLYLDLDRFKEVNDTLGHHSGDLLLQRVAHRIHGATRRTDVVARLGGDEFAIVQGELTDSSSAGTLAEKLIEIISAPYEVEGNDLRIGVSIGISIYTPAAANPDMLLAQADQALYRAKVAGRGRYRFYSEQIDREARAHLELAEDLRAARARGELQICYQPQVELATGRIVGMEALLRWNHPRRGTILPEDFLPIAEKFGLMQQIGRWVLNEACAQMARWRAQQLPVPVVAINVALAQIRTGAEFVRDVMESVARFGLQPSDVELDVTEGVLARATLAHSGVLEELRRLGVGVAIDDFGAQYSSLDYLRTYRVNRLKIARGMVAAADAEPGGGAMIRAILSLARELGVEVVAEGVETEAQRRLLVEANPRAQGQGFYYCRAVSAEDCMPLLRSGKMLPQGAAPEDPAAPP